MAIKFEMLRSFVAVAKAGELLQAANALGRTPSALSMTLKQLGEELGVALFETDRKAKLTRAGEAVLAEAERAVRGFEHSLAAIRHAAQSDAGFVRIAAVPSIATSLLPVAVCAVLKENPHLRLDIVDLDSGSIVRALLEERLDLGIATSGNARAGIAIEHLFEDKFEAVLPSHHSLAHRKSISLDALKAENFIGNGLCELIEAPAMIDLLSHSTLSVRTTSSLFAMIRAGVGVSMLPKMAAHQAGDGITFVPLKGCDFTRRAELLTPATRRPSPATAAMIKHLKTTAKTMRL